MRRLWWMIILLPVATVFGQTGGGDDTGRPFIEAAERSYRAGLVDEQEESTLRFVSFDREEHPVGKVSEYTMQRWIKYGMTSAEDRTRIWFTAPARDAGTWFLSLGHAEGEDEQHFKPAAARRARLVRSSESYDRFFGTDFFNRDLRPEKLAEHRYTVRRAETFDGHACTVVEARPTGAPGATEYLRRELWLEQKGDGIFVYLQIVFYDARDTVWKVQRNNDFGAVDPQHFPGVYRPRETTIEDRKILHQTTLSFDPVSRHFNTSIPDAAFDPRKLEQTR